MDSTERSVMKGRQNPSSQQSSQFSLVNQIRMKSKVSKFGSSSDGGENYSMNLDYPRKKKNNGRIKNPDDPQDGDTKTDLKGQQSKVPQFSSSDNRDNGAGYTTYFENKQKVNDRERTMSKCKVSSIGAADWLLYWCCGWCFCSCYGTFGIESEEAREPVINARFPVVDDDWIAERRLDNQGIYGGGKRLTTEPRGGNANDVGLGNSKSASRGFPEAKDGSKTPLRKKNKLLQLWNTFHKKGASFFKKATSVPRDKQINFSTKNAKMTLRNDTPHHH